MTTQALAALGVRVALDGVGSGSSSLSRMGDLQLGQLKMHAAFVEALGDPRQQPTLAQAIIALGRGLHPVVALGAETEAQWQALGCDVGQGFWFGEPAQACTFLSSRAEAGSGEAAAR